MLSRSARSIAEAARSLRASRREIMAANGWSLRDLYRNLATPDANRLRDAAVRSAYGTDTAEDTHAFRLALNQELADAGAKGVQLTPPGPLVPARDPAEFMNRDCVTVREGEGG